MIHTSIDTPVGELVVVADDDGVVRASGWEPLDELLARVLPQIEPGDVRAVTVIDGVTDATQRYFAGELDALDHVRVHQHGGPFMRRAWDELRRIEPGTPSTYTQLAAASGSPRAIRAAGAACADNGITPYIPCHRVVRSDGSLGGYRFGLAMKQWLLTHERTRTERG